jgi:hypothetical protein
MRMMVLAVAVTAAFVSACQAQPQARWGQQGWQAGPYHGPMMAYGYCPGAGGADGAPQGWYGPGMMGGGRGGGMMHGGGGPMMGRGGFSAEATTAWLEAAKAQIGVTAAQEQAWSAYADAVQADRASMAQMHAQMPMMQPGANAPDRLQAHLDLMQARFASLQQVQAASQALYQALSDDQRARANQTLWSGCW